MGTKIPSAPSFYFAYSPHSGPVSGHIDHQARPKIYASASFIFLICGFIYMPNFHATEFQAGYIAPSPGDFDFLLDGGTLLLPDCF